MISFDAASNGTSLGVTSLTYSHTNSGNILFVGASLDGDGTDKVSSITYGGVAMTLVAKVSANAETAYLYYLVNPAQGANNVVVTTSTTQDIRSACASYTGAAGTGQPDASTTNTNSSTTSLATALTTNKDNCWMISYCQSTLGVAPTAGTNVTSRAASTSSRIGDSNGVIHPAGSFSMTWTSSLAGLNVVQASFKPQDTGGGGFIFNVI